MFGRGDKRGTYVQTSSGKNYNLLWAANISCPGPEELSSFQQAGSVFNTLSSLVQGHGMSFLNNTLRTWIYIRDIHNHYREMVKARKLFFEEKGLNKDTHYVASTGIEGKFEDESCLVSLDALSISNLKKCPYSTGCFLK